MTLPVHLVVIAKHPEPGRVKTRLVPPCTPQEAADVAAACLADTLDAVRAAAPARRTLVTTAPPGADTPDDFTVLPQRGAGLDERLAAAFDDAAATDPAGLPLLLVGMDTPQVDGPLLQAAATLLLADGTDAVLGPATDGGWWALGLRRPDAGLLLGVPMSQPTTGAAQRARLVQAGLRVAPLRELVDVDTAADARAVAAHAPGTRFAAALASTGIGAVAGVRG